MKTNIEHSHENGELLGKKPSHCHFYHDKSHIESI